jgi:GNAT superfamily N-acetyltransferase
MIELRNAGLEDVALIQELAETTWWPTYEPIVGNEQVRYMLDAFYSTGVLSEQIGSGKQQYLILRDAGVAKGFAAYSPRDENPDVYKLHKLYCLPSAQRRGYGRSLLSAVEQAVLDSGNTILELNVNRHNKARTFYERLGFEVVYEEDIHIGNGFEMNDFVMRKVLKP